MKLFIFCEYFNEILEVSIKTLDCRLCITPVF
jgi:hypothetical protein